MQGKPDSNTITVDGAVVRGPASLRARIEAALDALSMAGQPTSSNPGISTYRDCDPTPDGWTFHAETASDAAQLKDWIDTHA